MFERLNVKPQPEINQNKETRLSNEDAQEQAMFMKVLLRAERGIMKPTKEDYDYALEALESMIDKAENHKLSQKALEIFLSTASVVLMAVLSAPYVAMEAARGNLGGPNMLKEAWNDTHTDTAKLKKIAERVQILVQDYQEKKISQKTP